MHHHQKAIIRTSLLLTCLFSAVVQSTRVGPVLAQSTINTLESEVRAEIEAGVQANAQTSSRNYQTNPLTSSLSDCQAFAALFDNTCTSTSTAYSNMYLVPNVTKSCSNAGVCDSTWNCTSTTSGSKTVVGVTFNRALCVTCAYNSSDNNAVYIRVQGNAMPSHCYYQIAGAPATQDVDFSVKWLSSSSTTNTQATSQTALDSLLCSVGGFNWLKIPTSAGFQYQGNNVAVANVTSTGPAGKTTTTTQNVYTNTMGDMVGVGLSGVLMGGAMNGVNEDPFYPALSYSGSMEGDGADVCGQHTNPQGALHYHYMPQCVSTGNTTLWAASSISNWASTTQNRTYSNMQGFDSSKGLQPVGIAMDGHVIWGPYKQDSTAWTASDVDICNGGYLDGSNYGYASTQFFPYFIGCWGPGTTESTFCPSSIDQGCTSNGRMC